MIEDDSKPAPLERVPSGVPGLDLILGGGFFRGGVYMILGRPGAGKTILGNQVCYAHAAAGGRALFITLLTESHARLIAYQRSMEYFRPELVGGAVLYLSGYEVLEKEKLKGLLGLLRNLIREHKATLVVIDGMVTVGSVAESDVEMKKFIHGLQVLVELLGCTTLLLTGANENEDQYPQRTMVDGLVQLRIDPAGMATARTVEIMKFRGGAALMGRHLFEITNAGITIHPRTEAVHGGDSKRPDQERALLSVGIKSLDKMLGGGVRSGSITMVLGFPGCGKTLLGASFLAAGARHDEPGLYLGFFETPEELVRKADGIGTDFSRHLRSGLIEILWQPPLELIADALAERLLAAVRARGVRRLFIDGIGGFRDSVVYPERTLRFFNALCNELRTLGVTTFLSDETRNLFGPEVEVPVSGLSAMLDNIILLRHVELRAQLHRLISVMKMREGRSDTTLREFSINEGGIDVSSSFESAEAILTGIAPRERRHCSNVDSSAAGEGARQEATESSVKTVMVVNDEHTIVEILGDLLHDEGYRVVSAANGKDGLERLRKEKPDLLLIDHMMPIADGKELIHGMRALPEFRSTPVVMMSAAPKSVALSNAQAAQFQVAAFLAKPFQLKDLLDVIERLIGKGDVGPR